MLAAFLHQTKAGLTLRWFCFKKSKLTSVAHPLPPLRWTEASFCLAMGNAPTCTLCTSAISLQWSIMKTQSLHRTVFIVNTHHTKFLSTSVTPFCLRSLDSYSNVKPIQQRNAKEVEAFKYMLYLQQLLDHYKELLFTPTGHENRLCSTPSLLTVWLFANLNGCTIRKISMS